MCSVKPTIFYGGAEVGGGGQLIDAALKMWRLGNSMLLWTLKKALVWTKAPSDLGQCKDTSRNGTEHKQGKQRQQIVDCRPWHPLK